MVQCRVVGEKRAVKVHQGARMQMAVLSLGKASNMYGCKQMHILSTILFVSVWTIVSAEWFPLDKFDKLPTLSPFAPHQSLEVECITRQIDNGEHKFDKDGNIIYTPFPVCRETNKPLSLSYGVDGDFNCTVGLTDELFHLFQLYIHQDVPFSCRLPISAEPNSIANGNAFIPFTLNFRGHVADSHLDIDSTLNVILTKPQKFNTLISAIGWSSGTNTSRVVIGDYLTIQTSVRWLSSPTNQNKLLPVGDGFYRLPAVMAGFSMEGLVMYCILTAVITSAVVTIVTYHKINSRAVKEAGLRSGFGRELGIDKSD